MNKDLLYRHRIAMMVSIPCIATSIVLWLHYTPWFFDGIVAIWVIWLGCVLTGYLRMAHNF